MDISYNQVAGATDFFAKLSTKQKSNIDFLSSHPAPAKRVKEINKIIKENKYSFGSTTPLPEVLQLN